MTRLPHPDAGIDIYGDDPLWVRLIGYFLGCGHHGVVHHPVHAVMAVQKCVLRSHHRGDHVYPKPWEAGA